MERIGKAGCSGWKMLDTERLDFLLDSIELGKRFFRLISTGIVSENSVGLFAEWDDFLKSLHDMKKARKSGREISN